MSVRNVRSNPVFLDSNAGAPLLPQVKEALLQVFEHPVLGNPSSVHAYGRKTKKLIHEARDSIAKSLGTKIDPEQLLFTSSGTEANQWVIRSVLENAPPGVWLTTRVEHDSVLQMIEWYEKKGGVVQFMKLDAAGRPSIESLQNVRLVSTVWVNNETGVISDVKSIIQSAQAANIPVHLDAAQAWGKIPLELNALGASYVTFSGHKIGALPGSGFVWLNRGMKTEPLIKGKQEKGRRGGTENSLGILAMGAAAQTLDPKAFQTELEPLRDQLERDILNRISDCFIPGRDVPRISNTLNLGFDGIEGEGLVLAMDLEGFCVSSGSACASGVLEPSHVLLALGRSRAQAMSAIRVSLWKNTKTQELQAFVDALERVVTRCRKVNVC